jgi:two-component system nitrate/nitrite response regulator NarL
MTRAVLIEDQSLFADVIQAQLAGKGVDVVAVAPTGADGLRAVRSLQPDLVLVDIRLPDMNGLEVGTQVLKRVKAKVVALTAHDDPRTVRQAIQRGFAGYLTKDMSTEEFASALSVILEGEKVFRQRLALRRRPALPEDGDAMLLASQLTEREREVLSLLANGVPGRGIAQALGVSVNTVRSHVQTILTKLQVHSRLEAAAFALHHGLVEVGDGFGSGTGGDGQTAG